MNAALAATTDFPPCPPPAASEYLLLIRGRLRRTARSRSATAAGQHHHLSVQLFGRSSSSGGRVRQSRDGECMGAIYDRSRGVTGVRRSTGAASNRFGSGRDDCQSFIRQLPIYEQYRDRLARLRSSTINHRLCGFSRLLQSSRGGLRCSTVNGPHCGLSRLPPTALSVSRSKPRRNSSQRNASPIK